ncbi:MAG: GNAT family N-acetyltransferase [Bacteroidia bacterium]|jgi:GNAT superfamily N-acetyltransferase
MQIRFANIDDTPLILSLIKGIADYEKLAHEVVTTETQLQETLFGPTPYAKVFLAFEGEIAVGFALFFHNYSTFRGKPGIYLEDLFVWPEHRGKGYGKALLTKLIDYAKEMQCGRVEWSVLDWNTPAIEFYKVMGAQPMDEWTVFRISLP